MPQVGSQPGTQVLTPEEAAAGGYTMGPAGYYLDADGNVAPGQTTPGMRDSPIGQIQYDKDKDLNYFLINGTKVYQSPVTYDANHNPVYKKTLHGDAVSGSGGGLVHGAPQWNPKTGTWDIHLDMGKIGAWAAGIGLTAGVMSAVMAPAAAPTIGSTGAGSLSATSTGLAVTPGLGTAGGGAAAATGGTAAAAGGTAAATTGATAPAATTGFGPLAGSYGAATPAATIPTNLAALYTPAAVAPAVVPPVVTAAVSPAIKQILLGALVGSGVDAVRGYLGQRAATKAAQIQADATDRAAALEADYGKQALDLIKQQNAQAATNQAPWIRYGSGALKMLGDSMGITPDMSVGGVPGDTSGAAAAPASPSPTFSHGPSPAALAPPTPPGGYGNKPTTLGAVMAPPGSQGAMVRISWPDGTQQTVARGQLSQYVALGATPAQA